MDALSQFHFIRPLLLMLLPIVLLLWYVLKQATAQTQWARFLPTEVVAVLSTKPSKQYQGWQNALLFCWLLLVFAAAGPAWEKQAVPLVQNQDAMVVVLDLSPSMLAQDLSPDRLTRAKFKLIDMLRVRTDGQTALVVYAGDAHTVSPLTDDPATIEALLPALHPSLMPSAGSNTESALALARQLMLDASISKGHILLITDGIAASADRALQAELNTAFPVSVLAVGGTEPAPIPGTDGGFLRRSNGEIVLSPVEPTELRRFANQAGGNFARLSVNNSDIDALIRTRYANETQQPADEQNDSDDSALDNSFDSWQDMGYLVLILALPLLLLCFRKGLIYVLPLFVLLPPDPAYANDPQTDNAAAPKTSWYQQTWNDLWKTKDQQGSQLLDDEQFSTAANTFDNKNWSAIANYKAGNYQQMVDALQGLDDEDSVYNKANALALSGDLEEALKAYQQVLTKNPEHTDAAHNKKLIEDLLKQNQQEQQNAKDSNDSEKQEGQEQQQDQQEQSESGQENNSEQQQSQDGQDQDSQEQDSQNQQSQQSDQQSDQQDSGNQENQENQESQSQNADSQEQGADDQQQVEKEAADTESPNGEEEQDTEQQAQVAEQGPESVEGLEEAEGSENAEGSEQLLLKDASEQWLRTIEDDPSGLLRRKFQYQARQRDANRNQESADERY